LFKEGTKQFCPYLGAKTIAIKDQPCMEEVIWEDKVKCNEEAEWIRREKREKEKTSSMNCIPIETMETTSFLSKTHNWKSPGNDQIPNYWLKAFPATHSYITKTFNILIEEPKKMPDWLTTGITYLLSKSEGTKEPKNYRLVTCLSTMYKTVTGISARSILSHLEEHNLLPAEQKGNNSGSRGCKDQLLISRAIFEDSEKRKKNLSIAWIDYHKAFDSVSHSWIEKSKELLGVNNKIVNFCKSSMEKCSTRLQLKTNQELLQSRLIKINRGTFQGD
jgi:hypothetical protein